VSGVVSSQRVDVAAAGYVPALPRRGDAAGDWAKRPGCAFASVDADAADARARAAAVDIDVWFSAFARRTGCAEADTQSTRGSAFDAGESFAIAVSARIYAAGQE
jgi:hypothetical protein